MDILLAVDLINKRFLARHRMIFKIGTTKNDDDRLSSSIKSGVRDMVYKMEVVQHVSPFLYVTVKSEAVKFCKTSLGLKLGFTSNVGFRVDIMKISGLQPWKINGAESWDTELVDVRLAPKMPADMSLVE
jgi:hypothetical protein